MLRGRLRVVFTWWHRGEMGAECMKNKKLLFYTPSFRSHRVHFSEGIYQLGFLES